MNRPRLFLATFTALFLFSAQAYAWTAWTTADLNMRSGPGTRYRVILVIPRHARVDVRHCDRWCYVSFAGYRGYVSRRYLAANRYRDGVYIYRTPPTYVVPRRIVPPPYVRPPYSRPPYTRPPSTNPPDEWTGDNRRREYRRHR